MASPPGERLRALLGHPLARDLPEDPAEATARHRRILESNVFLRRLYADWYRLIRTYLPRVEGDILELGSGPGFLREVITNAVTSDVIALDACDRVIDAHELPFEDTSLRAIVTTNVFHHFADPATFLTEATRTLTPGGRLVMIEPWVSAWSRFVYARFHHEPFDPSGPWGGEGEDFEANNALAWIVFKRDVVRFKRGFPDLWLGAVRPMMPLLYLISGGMSLKPLMPGWTYRFWRAVECCALPLIDACAMFALIVVEKKAEGKDYSRGTHP